MGVETETFKPRWGDADDENEELDFEDGRRILPETEEWVDDNGVKTIIDYSFNDEGQIVKTIKSTRTVKKTFKINKRVEARKKWRKFGHAANAPPGPEPGITNASEEILLDHKSKATKGDKDDSSDPLQQIANSGKTSIVICRNCGMQGDHWTLKCPYKDRMPPTAEGGAAKKDDTGGSSLSRLAAAQEAGGSAATSGGKYVPPSLRGGGASSRPGDRMRDPRDEVATIRVTNLSEDTKESDLQELFRPFGQIQRIYLAKDKVTHLSKGFAFINFVRREDAARAIEKLSGYGYDHLILHVEWAKPSGTG